MNNMSKKEFYEKYGDVPVKFSNYDRYIFAYYGIMPDNKYIICLFGGNEKDIHSHIVIADEYVYLKDIDFYYGCVVDKDAEKFIDGFYVDS
jgi:hypothetical protein